VPHVPEVEPWAAFMTARLVYDPAKRTAFALYSEPPAAADRVTAVLRSQSFVGAGRPHPDAIETLLIGRYGPPAESDVREGTGRVMLWFAPQGAEGELSARDRLLAETCPRTTLDVLLGEAESLNIRQTNPGRVHSVHWFDAAGEKWRGPDSYTADVADLVKSCRLGEVLTAIVVLDEDGLVRNFQVVLANAAAAAHWTAENKKAAAEAAPKGAQGALDIKL
jgi:hypothetical protein